MYYVLLINAKTAKRSTSLEEPCFESGFAACHDNTMLQIRKQQKLFLLKKIIAVGIILQIQKSLFFSIFKFVLKTTGISGM